MGFFIDIYINNIYIDALNYMSINIIISIICIDKKLDVNRVCTY